MNGAHAYDDHRIALSRSDVDFGARLSHDAKSPVEHRNTKPMWRILGHRRSDGYGQPLHRGV